MAPRHRSRRVPKHYCSVTAPRLDCVILVFETLRRGHLRSSVAAAGDSGGANELRLLEMPPRSGCVGGLAHRGRLRWGDTAHKPWLSVARRSDQCAPRVRAQISRRVPAYVMVHRETCESRPTVGKMVVMVADTHVKRLAESSKYCRDTKAS